MDMVPKSVLFAMTSYIHRSLVLCITPNWILVVPKYNLTFNRYPILFRQGVLNFLELLERSKR